MFLVSTELSLVNFNIGNPLDAVCDLKFPQMTLYWDMATSYWYFTAHVSEDLTVCVLKIV
jgi:hypothetical protein